MSESNVKFTRGRGARIPFARPARARSRSSPPSRWRRSATSASLIRRASRCRCARSPTNPGLRLRLYRQGQSRRRHLQRHRDPRPRQSRRARLQAGDGRQGGAVQALRRRRFDRHRGRRPRMRSASSTRSSCSSRASAASTSRTSPRPTASSSSRRLRERMNIPVFHDDQHGTAIITAAGLINACHLTGRKLKDIKVVVNGAGAAAIACTELIKAMGVRARPCHHVRPQGRDLPGPRPTSTSGSRRMRSRPTRARSRKRWRAPTCSSACRRPARSSPRWSRRWRKEPIIFAMANPDPEISPPDAKAARPDAIVATGRSDYPEPGQQRARLPLHLPRRARRARDRDQRGDEDRRGRSACRAGARAGAGGSRRGLWRHARTASAATTSSPRRSTRG